MNMVNDWIGELTQIPFSDSQLTFACLILATSKSWSTKVTIAENFFTDSVGIYNRLSDLGLMNDLTRLKWELVGSSNSLRDIGEKLEIFKVVISLEFWVSDLVLREIDVHFHWVLVNP